VKFNIFLLLTGVQNTRFLAPPVQPRNLRSAIRKK